MDPKSVSTLPHPEVEVADLDWDDVNNVDNPQNWPTWKKILHSAIPAVYGLALTMGTSTYVAGVLLVMKQFDISRTVALLPIVVYTIGFSLGPLIAAPISEIYGRLIVYRICLPMLMVFNIIAAASDNLTVLIVFRFLAGFGGSGVLAVGAGTVADIWSQRQAGLVALTYILAPFLGPTLGPLIGAYIIAQYDNDWKWSIWVIPILCAPIAVSLLFMQETSKSRIMYLKSSKTIKVTQEMPITQRIGLAMLRPLHMILLEPLAFFLSLYTGFNFAMIFSFFGSYSYVYSRVYGFNLKEIGLTYIGLIVGYLLALVTVGYFDRKKYQPESQRTNGRVAPEHRLYAAMFGSFLLPVGLFWFAWTPRESVHWIVPVLAGVPFGWGTLAVFLASVTYLMDTYQATNGASAIAANGFLRFILGAIFPLFTIQMYENLGIHWAGSIFAFISLVLIPVPWVFFWKGKDLRKRSSYETCSY
ncbi:hypothetical protein COCSADRAFT_40663 [Bipolaris sorokiniana ND90Pr]|uniref:Major facilitator superfamily (MFS) profile domain-containing protein n=1 Tax=Cochliobolus sativus (strain ND90Pr / ATCC 201652) TaxID=665912 RepID=M2STY1_COCSN|nr:uncharacterized protein COCSADRAFT_40663 [Bipolaris sorokiniana ND90Pr]EMD60232.1 hypothetical protein COCSADRAFT_40663 [Bipolaris sorokiniana ND90Pr]